MVAPIAIRQNEIPTDGTSDRNLAIMGDVLTEKVARTRSRTILWREINCILKFNYLVLFFDSFVSHDVDMEFQYFPL